MNRVIIPAALLSAGLLAACSHNYPDYPDGGARHAEQTNYTVTRHAADTEYAVPDQLLFATDSSEILPTGRRIVSEIAQVAKRHSGAPVQVAGFTDTMGTQQHNDKLSVARAEAVADALKQEGVEPGRIETRGYGERELAVPTPDQTDEARNRRVVVRIANSG